MCLSRRCGLDLDMTDSLEPLSASHSANSLARSLQRIGILLPWAAPALAVVVALAIFAPRLAVKDPSLIDDWFAITYGPRAVHELVHGHYDTALVDYGGRYRPSYALLNYIQWSLPGSRTSTTLPNLIGLGRLFLFMG